MRKLYLIALLGAVSVLALSVAPVAGATGCSPIACVSGSYLNIHENADLASYSPNWNGVFVSVDVQCTDMTGLGLITVDVTQGASQSANGIGSHGSETETVNCDGNTRTVDVFVLGDTPPGFNLGCAAATASLMAGSGNTAVGTTILIRD